MNNDRDHADFVNRCERIYRVLTGAGSETQGSILANLLSLWLAGHFIHDPTSGGIDRVATNELRTAMLHEFIKLVRDLIPLSEEELLEKIAEEQKDA
jgi:hypothetical protein